MGKVRAKLDCGAIVRNLLFLRVVGIFEKSQKGEAQDFILKMGNNSYKGLVYRRREQAMLFISICGFLSNNTSFIKVIFLLISEIVIISNQKWGSKLLHTMVHKGEGAQAFEFFPMHIDSSKLKIFSLIHHYRQFFHNLQHQFCQERTLILRQFCSTCLPRWRFCGWRQRQPERIIESDH